MDNKLLYGKGTTNNIVAVEVVPNKENTVQVWVRDGDELTSFYDTYKPYCYISKDDPVVGQFYADTPTTELLGGNPLNLMVESDSFSHISWVEKNAEKCYVPFRQSQWMLQTGETLFKGMNFDDPVRLYFDLEVLTKKGYTFPNSSRDEDKITLIAIWTNRGHEMVLALNDDAVTPKMENVFRCKNEKVLIEKFVTVIREIDPDIIANHNIYGFDFPYLRDRAQLLDVPLQIGRNGTEPRTYTTSIKFAEKSDEYENFVVYGRHILDTYFMAKKYDMVARKLGSLNLKECVKHLGQASDDRTYIEGNQIANIWRNEHDTHTREDLIRYAVDDVKEAQILDREWGIGIFEETKMMPLPMQDVARYGAGNKIDLIFDRQYYQALWSMPVADEKQSYGGGYAGSQVYGYIPDPMVYADVSSLYPTLAEILEIQPPKDELGVFQEMVHTLKEFRYKYKYLAKELKEKGEIAEAKKYDAAQNQYKILLNTGSYGWLGWQWGKFNYYEGAALITQWGQNIIKQVNHATEQRGGSVIRTDTDGSLIIVPEKFRGSEENELQFIKLVEDDVNQWLKGELKDVKETIVLEHDGGVKKSIVFDNKSYVLLGHDDKITIKGNTLRGRSNEGFVNEFIRTCVDHVFDENFEAIKDEYLTLRERISNKDMTIDEVSKREGLNMSLEEYRNKRSAGNNPISTYEAAVNADREYVKGDTIVTWVEEPKPIIKTYKNKPDKEIIPKTSSYELVRLAENYDKNIYVDHYLSRLDITCKKFLVVLGVERFNKWFPNISILKTDRRKLLPTMHVYDFLGLFPDHGWTSKCLEKLTNKQEKDLTSLLDMCILPEELESLINK